MPPVAPLDAYVEVAPIIRQVRVMQRFFDEVVDATPETRDHLAYLHCAYMDILQEEFAPHAFTLAMAVVDLEDAYPEVGKTPKARRS